MIEVENSQNLQNILKDQQEEEGNQTTINDQQDHLEGPLLTLFSHLEEEDSKMFDVLVCNPPFFENENEVDSIFTFFVFSF